MAFLKQFRDESVCAPLLTAGNNSCNRSRKIPLVLKSVSSPPHSKWPPVVVPVLLAPHPVRSSCQSHCPLPAPSEVSPPVPFVPLPQIFPYLPPGEP